MTKFDCYAAVAVKFAKDTKDWSGLDQYKCYTATAAGDWEETPGNEHGGIDVSWAFHLPAAEVKKTAMEHFMEELKTEIEQGAEEQWDTEQWTAVINKYFD